MNRHPMHASDRYPQQVAVATAIGVAGCSLVDFFLVKLVDAAMPRGSFELVFPILFGTLVGQACVLGTLGVFAPGYWLWRQVGVVVSGLAVMTIAVVAPHADELLRYPADLLWPMLGIASFLLAVQWPLWLFRLASGYTARGWAHGKRQFGLRDILIVTSVVAVALAVGRLLPTRVHAMELETVAIMSIMASVAGLLTVPTVWLMLASSRLPHGVMWAIWLAGHVLLWGAAYALLTWLQPRIPWEVWVMPATAYVTAMGLFGAMRLLGFRLVRGQPAANPPQANETIA